MELIKGTWYKNIGISQNIMGKYKEPKGSTAMFSEYFYEGEYHNKEGNASYEADKIALCDDDDLRKILPADHPDHPNPRDLFIPGEWYNGGSSRYMKFSHIVRKPDYNILYFTEEITRGKHKVIADYWANTEMEKYALTHPVSSEEISEFLPDGHSDKISKPQKKRQNNE